MTVRRRQVRRAAVGQPDAWSSDELSAEEPLEIRLNGTALAVTMRTPGDDFELAAGFLISEGIIARSEEIATMRACPHAADTSGQFNVIEVALRRPSGVVPSTRSFYMTSSCGICGKASIDAVRTRSRWDVREDQLTVSVELLAGLPERLREAQRGFARTGGLHAAALFDAAGGLLCAREDVGRHNAFDKVVGWAATERRLPLAEQIMLVSGRTSFELVQKALMAGVPLLAAVSAPSSLAAELAFEAGLTLVGFLRGDRMNVYTGHHRVLGA